MADELNTEGKKPEKILRRLAILGLAFGVGTAAYQVHKFTSDARSLEFLAWPKLLDPINGLPDFKADTNGLIAIPLTLMANNRTTTRFEISNLVMDFYHLEELVGSITHQGFNVPGFSKTRTELPLLIHKDKLNLQDIGSAFIRGGLNSILKLEGQLQASIKLPFLSWRIPYTLNDTIKWQA